MDQNKLIQLKKHLNVTDLAGEKVMVDFEAGKYYLIKGVGNDIWDMLGEGITVGEIMGRLLKDYDVSQEECEKSVFEFLERLQKLGIID